MAVNEKVFLSFDGLSKYDELIKEYINEKNAAVNTVLDTVIDDIDSIETVQAQHAAAINLLNADASTEGSVSYKVKLGIESVIGGASEALDTLKEIEEWIRNDESGTTDLITRVADLEKHVDTDLVNYVDKKVDDVYRSIGNIEAKTIDILFLNKVFLQENQTLTQAIATLPQNSKLVLKDTDVISETVSIPANVVIDGNGAEMSGVVSVSKDAVVMNVKFTGIVTVV